VHVFFVAPAILAMSTLMVWLTTSPQKPMMRYAGANITAWRVQRLLYIIVHLAFIGKQ